MRTTIQLEETHVDALKQLAVNLGLFQTRGAGTGVIPSVSAVIRLLAEMADNNEFFLVVCRLMGERYNLKGPTQEELDQAAQSSLKKHRVHTV